MLNTYALKAEARTAVGTGPARELRRRNMVPAIIYGSNKESVMVALPEKELTIQFHKQGFLSHMFDIEVGKNKYRALPKAFQLHPVTDAIEHMDFVHVNEKEKIKINVTLHFVNEAKCPGLKQGGVFNIARHALEVFCLASNIPENIEVDVAELAVGQTIHVSDLKLPTGVETKLDQDATIATIVAGKTSVDNTEESASEEK
ncbi:MAG: 50S ribosomal protein L25/general stress protein Ctc [Pseudomonadota bacterium]